MKAPAVLTNQQQRKEAKGKEIAPMHLRRINKDERDQEKPRIWRAAIYLSEPVPNGPDEPRSELSIDQQQVLCHLVARVQRIEVLGEFVDAYPHLPLRPGLHRALEFAQEQRLDYLIVSSLDRLADDPDAAFEAAWRLGHAGTAPLQAEQQSEPHTDA